VVSFSGRLLSRHAIAETLMTEVLFIVEEAPEGGYTARTAGVSIFTEGETTDEIRANVRDAVAVTSTAAPPRG
jgi:hypothetical protein